MSDSRLLNTQWKKGPLPKDTWNWGGVVTTATGSNGFHFADFRGDHALLFPDGTRADAVNILYYNNALDLPPAS